MEENTYCSAREPWVPKRQVKMWGAARGWNGVGQLLARQRLQLVLVPPTTIYPEPVRHMYRRHINGTRKDTNEHLFVFHVKETRSRTHDQRSYAQRQYARFCRC
jgi:hypothetical protein